MVKISLYISERQRTLLKLAATESGGSHSMSSLIRAGIDDQVCRKPQVAMKAMVQK